MEAGPRAGDAGASPRRVMARWPSRRPCRARRSVAGREISQRSSDLPPRGRHTNPILPARPPSRGRPGLQLPLRPTLGRERAVPRRQPQSAKCHAASDRLAMRTPRALTGARGLPAHPRPTATRRYRAECAPDGAPDRFRAPSLRRLVRGHLSVTSRSAVRLAFSRCSGDSVFRRAGLWRSRSRRRGWWRQRAVRE